MNTRTIVIVLLAAGLAAAGCGIRGGEPEVKPAAQPAATVTVTATPSVSPAMRHAETKLRCSAAVAVAAPSWDDWNFDLRSWEADPRTPEACKPLADDKWPPRGNRNFQDALIDGLRAADDPRARQ